jgi:histidinol-phosphate/aromatic aminotransferase/cobyric acid decarboxylase-like protein
MQDGEGYSAVSLLTEYDNLSVFKAFTKMYAMAGVRLGYVLCANRSILDALDKAGPPWSVSSVAQACGLAALDGGVCRRTHPGICLDNAMSDAALNIGVWVCPSLVIFCFSALRTVFWRTIWSVGAY